MSNLSRFADPQVFRRFAPNLLAQFLSPYAEILLGRGIQLPSFPTEDNMPYEPIARLFLHADQNLVELFDAVHLVNRVAANKGRGAIMEAAKKMNVKIPNALSCAYDVALWTWLNHPKVIERAGYRVTMHNARSFFYFSSFLGGDMPPLECTQEKIQRFAETMGSFYSAASKGGIVKVLDEMEGDELWLLIRHGGYLERRGDVDNETGEVSTICFRDEEYDVLIYNTRHKELKIRNTSDTSIERMLFEFGQIFFGSAHTFVQRDTFPVSLLCGTDFSFLRTTKVPGVSDVKLSEVRYMLPGSVTTTIHAKSSDLLQSTDKEGRIIPFQATRLDYAKLLFRFEHETRYRSVELFSPNKSAFARESDAPKVEAWLRAARLMQGGCETGPDERFFKALNIHLGQSLILNEWKHFFGDTFERVEPFLQDTGRDGSYWCAPGSAQRFDCIREGETITVLSPDYENSPELEKRQVDPAELRLFKLCPCSLSVRLSQSLGIDQNYCSLDEGIYRLGTLRGPDSRRHRAFLLTHAERSPVSLVKQVVGQEGEGIMIVTPSFCPDTSDFAVKNKLLYVPLRDMLRPDFSLAGTFDESRKQFFALHAEKELLTTEQITGFLAVAQALDGDARLKVPAHTAVLQLYCVQGLSTDEIAEKHGFAKGTVINRKKALERKLGRDLNELRAYSDQFERVAISLSDDRARRIDRKSAITGELNFDDD